MEWISWIHGATAAGKDACSQQSKTRETTQFVGNSTQQWMKKPIEVETDGYRGRRTNGWLVARTPSAAGERQLPVACVWASSFFLEGCPGVEFFLGGLGVELGKRYVLVGLEYFGPATRLGRLKDSLYRTKFWPSMILTALNLSNNYFFS